eukprot:8029064-Karenia_brevis.AAC.1
MERTLGATVLPTSTHDLPDAGRMNPLATALSLLAASFTYECLCTMKKRNTTLRKMGTKT